MPSAIVTILYPKTSTSTFDMEYYLSKHMPLVQEKWGSKGLQSWSIAKVDPASGYCVHASLVFQSVEAFQTAAKEDGPSVMGDVQNFSSEHPLMVVGEQVASS